ncbi:uncharacterized protein RJT21DRAFT_125864 [Scheffersomyces amazonensis]|uniref:uncharacterized protein n=1 Tax=Scheffersomyces amazonensis TaxID=1078765 RepID=UPI00315D16EE
MSYQRHPPQQPRSTAYRIPKPTHATETIDQNNNYSARYVTTNNYNYPSQVNTSSRDHHDSDEEVYQWISSTTSDIINDPPVEENFVNQSHIDTPLSANLSQYESPSASSSTRSYHNYQNVVNTRSNDNMMNTVYQSTGSQQQFSQAPIPTNQYNYYHSQYPNNNVVEDNSLLSPVGPVSGYYDIPSVTQYSQPVSNVRYDIPSATQHHQPISDVMQLGSTRNNFAAYGNNSQFESAHNNFPRVHNNSQPSELSYASWNSNTTFREVNTRYGSPKDENTKQGKLQELYSAYKSVQESIESFINSDTISNINQVLIKSLNKELISSTNTLLKAINSEEPFVIFKNEILNRIDFGNLIVEETMSLLERIRRTNSMPTIKPRIYSSDEVDNIHLFSEPHSRNTSAQASSSLVSQVRVGPDPVPSIVNSVPQIRIETSRENHPVPPVVNSVHLVPNSVHTVSTSSDSRLPNYGSLLQTGNNSHEGHRAKVSNEDQQATQTVVDEEPNDSELNTKSDIVDEDGFTLYVPRKHRNNKNYPPRVEFMGRLANQSTERNGSVTDDLISEVQSITTEGISRSEERVTGSTVPVSEDQENVDKEEEDPDAVDSATERKRFRNRKKKLNRRKRNAEAKAAEEAA